MEKPKQKRQWHFSDTSPCAELLKDSTPGTPTPGRVGWKQTFLSLRIERLGKYYPKWSRKPLSPSKAEVQQHTTKMTASVRSWYWPSKSSQVCSNMGSISQTKPSKISCCPCSPLPAVSSHRWTEPPPASVIQSWTGRSGNRTLMLIHCFKYDRSLLSLMKDELHLSPVSPC